MGNTKHIYFDGEVKGENAVVFNDPAHMKSKLRADYYACTKVRGEYLNSDGDGFFVIGAALSSSMNCRLEPLVEALESGTIVRCDASWSDVWVMDVFEGEVVGASVYDPVSDKEARERLGGTIREHAELLSRHDLLIARVLAEGIQEKHEWIRPRGLSDAEMSAHLRVRTETPRSDVETQSLESKGLAPAVNDAERSIMVVLPEGWRCSVMTADSGCEAATNPYGQLPGKDYPCGVDVTAVRREPQPEVGRLASVRRRLRA